MRLPSVIAALFVAVVLVSPGARADVARLPPHTVISQAPPDGRHELAPAGRVTVTPTAIPAGDPSQSITVTLTLVRPVQRGTFAVRLPARWSSGGSQLAHAVHLAQPVGTAAKPAVHGRTAVVRLARTPAGAKVGIAFERLDPPAGAYSLALLWRSGSGKPSPARRARVVVLGRTTLPTVHANAAARGLRVGGRKTLEDYDSGSDPGIAADPFGNLWLSFVAYVSDFFGEPIGNSRIVVNRVAAGAGGFQALNTGLPRPTGSVFQDKNMIAADTAPGSPHFGRLYLVWTENAFDGQSTVISFCDTVASGGPNPARCEDPSNWTAPARVTDSGGSHIAADVAAAPNGDVFVVWWDYSTANRIEGDVCRASSDCSRSSGWGADQTVHSLNGDGVPVPFSCPTLAAPGGRVNPVPSIAVNGVPPNSGRVYVTNGDIRPGTTKCSDPVGASTDGEWDVIVSSGLGALPAPNSGVSLTGGLGGDNFLPWTDADEATGAVTTAFYKTSPDATRHTALYSVRSLDPASGAPTAGIATLATQASDFSGLFSNGFDYGDYNGIDAANGNFYPVWTDGRVGPGGFPCCEVFLRKVVAGTPGAEKNLTASSPEGAVQGAETSVATAGSGDTTAVLVGANSINLGPPMLAFLSRDDGASFTRLSVPTDANAPTTIAAAATSPPPPVASDSRAPRLRLRVRRRQAFGRRRAVLVTASCDERCTLSARGTVRVRGGSGQKLKKVARSLGPGVEVTLKLRLSRKGLTKVRRAISRGRRAVARISIKATDLSGNASSVKRTITLTR